MRILICVFALTLILLSCDIKENKSTTLRIIHAGSFGIVLNDIIQEFKKHFPDVVIHAEAWGSKDGARQITELGKTCDIYISSDINVIEQMLIPKWARWYIPFAGNEMVIAFNSNSRYANEIDSNNWYEILIRDNVRIGRSDPSSDPCGARTVILLKLADIFYIKNISDDILSKSIPFMRPKETELVPLLQTNSIDYAFLYLTLAIQHGFKYIKLPDSINLSQMHLAEYYSKVDYLSQGRKPYHNYKEFGKPIIYGVTIPVTAKNPKLAEQFILFMLHPDHGGKIIKKHNHKSIDYSKIRLSDQIPESLKVENWL